MHVANAIELVVDVEGAGATPARCDQITSRRSGCRAAGGLLSNSALRKSSRLMCWLPKSSGVMVRSSASAPVLVPFTFMVIFHVFGLWGS